MKSPHSQTAERAASWSVYNAEKAIAPDPLEGYRAGMHAGRTRYVVLAATSVSYIPHAPK